ncbi:MAG TPA: undecaprenyl-phosphate galactose phosphotransferase WbaP [Bryobacteraceae bacterium]|jgi:Undecaprenyl-phosphate galactose phosphotransferase WbaP|nr:undecaprenyl-phosphate galactose phosphotransferase WbaP [Bryobacteraceae bacterium]
MTPALALAAPAAGKFRPGLRILNILCADLAGAAVPFLAAVLLRSALGGHFELAFYARSCAALLLFPLAYALFGQYSPVAHHPVREIRRLSAATTLVFVLFAVLLFLFKAGIDYSRAAFLGAWLMTLVAVPCARALVRKASSGAPSWGCPVAVFGTQETARQLIEGLQAQPETGLRPAAVFLAEGGAPATILGVPVLGPYTSAPLYARRLRIRRAIVMFSDLQRQGLPRMLESHANVFSKIYLMPGLGGFSSFGVETRDVCGGVALELRRDLLVPSHRLAKRAFDLAVSGALLILLLPLMLLIAALIRLESPGGVLFSHGRIGRGGRRFKMWKFRTMYLNGAEILEKYFKDHPAEEQYWRENMKLRRDPRITPLGRLLRKISFDELPQLWNVLRGEMSLVGPRPIVNDEVTKYGDGFNLYCRVTPGLTGLWQVSGRSTTSYSKRVELDAYYVRNWSPWLDIYLLARTIRTVLLGEGAY